MNQFFTLAYKKVDSKGREKSQKYVGVFKNLELLEQSKKQIINNNLDGTVSFQIYSHERLF